jgi:hypothetical protein
VFGSLLVPAFLGLLQLVTCPLEVLGEPLALLPKAVGLTFFLSLDANAVLLDVALQVLEVGVLLFEFFLKLAGLLLELGVVGPKFAVAVL